MGQATSQPTLQVPRLQEADLPPLPPLPPPISDPLEPVWSLWGGLTRPFRSELEEEEDTLVEFQIVQTAPLDETPSCFERRWENAKNSRLYQLPQETITRIRDQADYPTRILLRQSCFLFLRVVSNLDRARPPEVDDDIWRTAVANYFNGRLLFPIHGTAREFESRRHEWRDIVYRDIILEICSSCRAHRQSPGFKSRLNKLGESIRCDCKHSRHMRLFLSKRQGKTKPIEYGCIIQESPVQLCSHLSLSRRVFCQLQHEAPPPGDKYRALLCHDREHEDQSPTIKGYKSLPFIEFQRNGASLVWISPAFDLDPRVPVTRQHLRDFVRSQKVAGGLAFCPHVHAQDERLLLPFDPDQCACFDHDDDIASESSAGRYHYHDPEKGTGNCCRCYSQQHPEEKGRFLRPDPQIHHGKRAIKSVRSRTEERSVVTSAFHEYKCPQCFAIYAWVRGMDYRVYLRCRRDLNAFDWRDYLRSVTPEWASINDSEIHRITWCDDLKCKTGALWTRIYNTPSAKREMGMVDILEWTGMRYHTSAPRGQFLGRRVG